MVEVDELFRRERGILAKLQILSDAQAGQAFDNKLCLHRAHPDGSPPAGVDLSDNDGPPSKQVSLFGYHEWHISQERKRGDRGRRLRAVVIAELDYEDAVCRKPVRVVPRETLAEGRRRVASSYPGEHPRWVATREDVTESAVRKWRKSFGFDPTTGERLAA